MADIISQLQASLDQLAAQFYAALLYITTYHDHSPAQPIRASPNPDDPSQPSTTTTTPRLTKITKNPELGLPSLPEPLQVPPEDKAAAEKDKEKRRARLEEALAEGRPPSPDLLPAGPQPDPPHVFLRRQRELARELVGREKQVEELVGMLPGVDRSEEEQVARIRELGEELRVVEGQRMRKRRELKVLRERVLGLLGAVDRGIAP